MKRRSHLVHGWVAEAFPDEPIYCEAPQTSKDVIYSGSEDEAYNCPTERRERYEDKGQRFLQGKPLLLLSASLRGPFTKESGWKNPWRSSTGGKRRLERQALQSTPGRVQEESIVIAATPTILEPTVLESAVHGTKEESPVDGAPSPRLRTPTTPHRYLDDEILHEIKTWQQTVANHSDLEDPFDDWTDEPSSPNTLEELEVETTPKAHGSRPLIVSSSGVAEKAFEKDPVDHIDEDIVEQNEDVNLGHHEEQEAEVINIDDEDDSTLTDLDDEEFEEQIEGQNEEQEEEEEDEDEEEEYHTAEDEGDQDQEHDKENQQISASQPVQPPPDYDSPTKRPIASQPLPQPHGKVDLRPRESLAFLPLETVDLSPVAVKIYEESLRGSTCYTPSWRAQERKKQGNLLPGLVGAALPGNDAAKSPSCRSGRSVHASPSDGILHDQRKSNKSGSITLDHQTIESEHMLVDNQQSESEETKDSPNEPSGTPSRHQQITVARPKSPQDVIHTTEPPQPNADVAHTAPEMTEGEQKSHTTDPTSPSSSETSSPATSFEEGEEEEPVESVRKLLWPKTQRKASTQGSTPGMALGTSSATVRHAKAGLMSSQNGHVSASEEHDEGQGSLEYLTMNQQPKNDRERAKVEFNGLDSQSPSRFLQSQSQPQLATEATVSEESIYDDTINQVRLEWPVEASILSRQSQVQTQNSITAASIEEPWMTKHDTPTEIMIPEQPKRSVNVMALAHITNPASRNATPVRQAPGLQKPLAEPLTARGSSQPRSSATPEPPVNPEPVRSQLSVIASQALAQGIRPVVEQSPWAKGDSQIAALGALAPEPRCFNPVSSPLSSPASSSCFVDMENPALPLPSRPPVPGNNVQQQEEEEIAVPPPARAETPQASEPPHPPSTPETKRSSLPTPEFTMSIKSFKHFMTPSPPRPAKRPRFSLGDGRLPDTQALEEAVVTNPWDSSSRRLDAAGNMAMAEPAVQSVSLRKAKRVSWAPLPGEADYVEPDDMDVDIDMGDPDQPPSSVSTRTRTTKHRPTPKSILATSASRSRSSFGGIPRRAASPPPTSMPSIDALPAESQKFGKHFAIMSGRRRLAPRPVTATPAAMPAYAAAGYGESPMHHLRDVSGNARNTTGTPRSALVASSKRRLLPSESQQTCGSPAVDGMANAFVQADHQMVENLKFKNHQLLVPAQANSHVSGNNNEIWQDTGAAGQSQSPPEQSPPEQQQPPHHQNKQQKPAAAADNDNAFFRLPTLPGFDDSQPQFQFQEGETDEVTEVMDNLDDFIDSWDIDEELAEARRGEKTTKRKATQPSKLGLGQGGLSFGLGLESGTSNLWDSPSSRPQQSTGTSTMLKRKRTGHEGEREEDGMVESQGSTSGGGRGGGIYDPGVWDRIV